MELTIAIWQKLSLGHNDQVNANPIYLAEFNNIDVTKWQDENWVSLQLTQPMLLRYRQVGYHNIATLSISKIWHWG